MPHIALPELPGILSLYAYRTDVAEHILRLTQLTLRADSPLSPGERELIAGYVSHLNECRFCDDAHCAIAGELLGDASIAEAVVRDPSAAPISARLKSLLAIAAKVQRSGRAVTGQDVASARAQGVSDREIHDTVLVASLLSMVNRYVDGLAAFTPEDKAFYTGMAGQLSHAGYTLDPTKLQTPGA
jgi:uncharacterized peroxidase-related enzyme